MAVVKAGFDLAHPTAALALSAMRAATFRPRFLLFELRHRLADVLPQGGRLERRRLDRRWV